MKTRKAGQGSNWIRRSTRLAIYHRDHFCCVYCGAGAEDGELTLDHVLPCELGGDNAPTNLATCCRSCNSAKQDRTIRGWFAALRDRGVDTRKVGARVRRQTAKALDRKAGRALLKARSEVRS